MASKNSGPGGMRILWLPGRKKQHRKGEYKPTKTAMANYGSTPQRNRNEMWTMGGSRGQKDLITADMPHDLTTSLSTTTSHAASVITDSVGLAAAAGGVVVSSQNAPVQPLSEVISVECEDKPKIVVEDFSNENEPSDNNSHSSNKNCYENSSTLALRDRRKHNSGAISDDLDSIEALDDHSQQDQKSDFDSMDGISLSNNNASLNKLRKRSQSKKQNGRAYDGDDATIDYDDDDKKPETNEKLVTCLYYSMMCCECSIS